MDVLKKLVAVYLVLVGLAVMINFMVTPLYHDGSDVYEYWTILNWFMAVATPIVLLVNVWRKHTLPGDADMRQYVGVNVWFYASIVLTMLFFWEWFWTLNPESETGLAVNSHMIYFPLMDSMLTVLCFATSRYLWKNA